MSNFFFIASKNVENIAHSKYLVIFSYYNWLDSYYEENTNSR